MSNSSVLAVIQFPALETALILSGSSAINLVDGGWNRVVASGMTSQFNASDMGTVFNGVNVERLWDSGVLSLASAITLAQVGEGMPVDNMTTVCAVYESDSVEKDEDTYESLEHDPSVLSRVIGESLLGGNDESFQVMWTV